MRAPTLLLLVTGIVLLNFPTKGAIALPNKMGGRPEFAAAGGVEEYAASTLYEYINGGADVYIEAGAKKCFVRRYTQAGKKDAAFEVAVYDMGTDLNAFGIFRQLRTAGGQGIGTESAASPRMVAFWKSTVYAEVTDQSAHAIDPATLSAFARIVADLIPGEATMPSEIGQLPDSMMVKGTERYWKSGFLSRGFFKSVLSATYRKQGNDLCTLFVMLCASDSAAETAMNVVADAYNDENARVKVLASGRTVAGCVGCRKEEQEGILLGLLLEHLRKR